MTLQTTPTRRIHPQKFALWVGLAGIVMAFAALTSAYIVRRGAGDWFEVPMPAAFLYSTALILSSSIVLHGALMAFRDGKEGMYKLLLVLGFMLGLGFLVAQYEGWMYLKEIGLPAHRQTNASVSFIYLLTYLHAGHVLGGITALTVALVHAFALPFKASPKRILRLEMTNTYWHFVDFLWVYLLIFFYTQR